jgi:serine protease Do
VNFQNNNIYSFHELYEKTIESTVEIRSYYDSKLDDKYSTISWLLHGDIFDEKSGGTGFIYSNKGYIVTNAHVIKEANYFKIRFSDDTSYTAKLIGCDKRTDLAVLKIDKENLTSLILADEEIEIGQWIYTVGNPLYFQNSLSVGVVAGKNIRDNYCDIEDFIQLDINTNPGNSGSPVLTLNGKVIGIVTWGFNPLYATGMSFIIPTNIIKKISNQLIKNGQIKEGKFGFETIKTEGRLFKISSISAKSPAEKAGLKKDDQILEYDGIKIISLSSFHTYVSLLEVGEVLTLKIFRNTEEFFVSLKKE